MHRDLCGRSREILQHARIFKTNCCLKVLQRTIKVYVANFGISYGRIFCRIRRSRYELSWNSPCRKRKRETKRLGENVLLAKHSFHIRDIFKYVHWNSSMFEPQELKWVSVEIFQFLSHSLRTQNLMNTDLFLFELEEATVADPVGQEDAEGTRPTPPPRTCENKS